MSNLPPELSHATKTFGEAALRAASLRLLGYPAEWITERSESVFLTNNLKDGPMELSTEGIKGPDDLNNQNSDSDNNSVPPGSYHVMVSDAHEVESRGSVVVDFKILAGTCPGQEGKTFTEWYKTSAKALKRLTRLALVTGIMEPGVKKDVDFAEARGKHLIIEVVDNAYVKKDGTKVSSRQVSFFGMWALDHEDVKTVPTDKEAIAAAKNAPAASLDESPAEAAESAKAGDDDQWASIL
jgi:hypothetical protein